MNRYFLLILIIVFISEKVKTQTVFPIDENDGQVIESCSGFFTDSGADTLTPYQNSENLSTTISVPSDTENDRYIKVTFEYFELSNGDYLEVYDGQNESAPLLFNATGNELQGQEIWAQGESLHFRFSSSPSDTAGGWWAEIECFELCESFVVSVIPENENNTFDLCPGFQTLAIEAIPEYLGGDPQGNETNYEFEWNFSGEIFSTPQVSIDYEEPGAYPFSISVSDEVNNCFFDTIITTRVATIPNFNTTQASADTVCAEETFSLIGSANPTTWTGFPTISDTVAFISPENPFESAFLYDVFPEGETIMDLQDFDQVCIRIEHEDFGHLQFELECPSGNTVLLKDFGLGGANLGEPVTQNPDESIPGKGYEYCFDVAPQFGTMDETTFQFHEYTDQAGDYYINQPYMPEGTYTSVESLEALSGCPLNGSWKIRAEDNTEGTSGHVTGWSLFFNDSFYPDSLIFTPEIIEEQWFDENDTPLEGNPAITTIEEEGEKLFRFTATDNFGCTWDTTVTVFAHPLPEAEIISELELPVCEEDSTLFKVEPINAGDEITWNYQWLLEGTEWEGRIYDTIMAKEPASYSVRVTDTITGCFDIFEETLTTQNCDLTIPNVFTPNGDGVNDLFEIENLEYYPENTIVIYNRHGKKVFEENNYENNWWDGGNFAQGTYYYVLTYSRQGKKRDTHGVISLIR
ncbi:MAG: gliding motility-associated C-terminal domain-containing protein [Bacteroidota bacterium]